jgi:hypothetical protein
MLSQRKLFWGMLVVTDLMMFLLVLFKKKDDVKVLSLQNRAFARTEALLEKVTVSSTAQVAPLCDPQSSFVP